MAQVDKVALYAGRYYGHVAAINTPARLTVPVVVPLALLPLLEEPTPDATLMDPSQLCNAMNVRHH